uniref:tRNA pseudouridine(55) synthase n=1 Tax=Rhizophora mucronata TaxID=61149 RepID=A0A2P2JQK1_RHIMU
MKLLKDAVVSLPSHAVKHLLSKKVCMRCIFGLFGINRQAYLFSTLLPSLMPAILEEPTDTEGSGVKENEDLGNTSARKGLEVERDICSLCLGILQFTYRNDEKMVVKEQGADEFTASIANLVQQEGHQMDSFSLEVSIPSTVKQNEQVVWSYVKGKYGSEHWLQGGLSELISTKDALKYAVVNSLEALLGVKSGPSSYRICLTYTESQALSVAPNMMERNGVSKRKKTVSGGASNRVDTVNDELVGTERASNLEDQESATWFKFSKERVSEPCDLVVHCYRTPIYFGGRYLKFSRNVSQTRWIIDEERMGDASVEEIIGGNILPAFRGDSYKFHAAGREDIDVRMLGSGRPFLVEVQNARQVPCDASVKQIETNINDSNKNLVGVKNLKVVTSHGWTLMHEGEAEKQVYPFFSPSFGLNLGFSMPYPLGSNSIINQGN